MAARPRLALCVTAVHHCSMATDDELRARIVASPDTKQIADSLGLEFDKYVDMVLHFKKNPNAEPILDVMSDEDAAAQGIPSLEDAEKMFQAMLENPTPEPEHHKSKFAGITAGGDENSVTGSRPGVKPKAAPPMPGTKK
jgi:hypothetical protein